MNQEAKALLKRSINHFLSVSDQEKDNCIIAVENNLKAHYNSLKTIGFGCAENNVLAGKVFLRIFKNK